MTEEDLRDSLLFYRRRLTEKIILAMIAKTATGRLDDLYVNPAHIAEDLANAICERLAARETGRPEGYQ